MNPYLIDLNLLLGLLALLTRRLQAEVTFL